MMSNKRKAAIGYATYVVGSRVARICGKGLQMRVLACDPRGGSLARCAAADGIPTTVETALVGPVERGEVVLVHAGVALVRLDVEWAP